MRARFPLAIALGLAFATSAASQALTAERNHSIKRATVRLEISGVGPDGQTDSRVGTGFVISPRGYVLTAYHNLLYNNVAPYVGVPHRVARFNGANTPEVPFEVVRTNPELGLALLRLREFDEGYPRVILCRNPQVPEFSTLYAFGYPDSRELGRREGPFDSPNGLNGRWQTGIPVSPGMSGGPVVNDTGRVVGLLELTNTTPGNRSTVTPIQWTADFASIAFPRHEKCD